MTTITTDNKEHRPVGSLNTWEESLQVRQQDTGWGRAIAHIIPVYPLIYAITRRTITPMVCGLAGNVATKFLLTFLLVLSEPGVTERQIRNFGSLSLLAAPVFVKLGINSSRKQGAKRLQEIT